MTPSEMSAALKKIASKLEASRNPSKELVLADLKKIVVAASKSGGAPSAKVSQEDKHVAEWKKTHAEHHKKLSECGTRYSECMSSSDYKGASDACAEMSECLAEMHDMASKNPEIHAMVKESMQKHHGEKSHEAV